MNTNEGTALDDTPEQLIFRILRIADYVLKTEDEIEQSETASPILNLHQKHECELLM